jgi:quercetin dioxygenase-like cupin family protein
MSEDGKRPKRRVEFFYAKDAGPLDHDRMPTELTAPEAGAGLAKLMQAAPMGAGEDTKLVFAEAGATGMSIVKVWFKSGYILPAHSHSSDCLYYVVAGQVRMGKHLLGPGDGFFLPADHAYSYEAGPEGVELLEFRNATHFNIVINDVGEARWNDMAEQRRERAVAWADEPAPSARS